MIKLMHRYITILKYQTSTSFFKGIFLLLIGLAFYGTFILGSGFTNFFDVSVSTFQFDMFNIILFGIFSVSTIYSCFTFEQVFSNYIIRLRSKAKYLQVQLIQGILLNLYLALLFICLYLGCSLLMGSFNFIITSTSFMYDTICNFDYFLFYIVRYFLILFGFEMVLILLYHYFGKKFSYMALFAFLIDFVLVGNIPFSTLTTLQLNPCVYLHAIQYSSFTLEFRYSCIYLTIIYIVLFLLGFGKSMWEDFKNEVFFTK